MIKSTIEPACTGQFSSLFIDYIGEKESLKPFFSLFPTLENFRQLIERRTFDQHRRQTLAASLDKQYEGFEIPDPVRSNIRRLGNDKTFTVTTGHQLNLFTGPLYFIYKIVSTINLAEKLNKAYPAYHFVPVYWMASEDHDFEEINHFYFDGKKYSWNTDQKGAVGDFELDQELRELVTEERFVPELFRTAYLEHRTLADAVRYYVNYLFGERGLVIVDGHSKDLKNLFRSVIHDDIFNHTAHKLVTQTSEELNQLGYNGQIFPREINFFYLDKGIRERIAEVDGGFQVIDTDLYFTKEEIAALIEDKPEKFSPNVVMRPLYQEVILPNLAYLGGPAEVSYWLQLKPMFDHFQVDYPAVMPRNFVMILDKVVQRKMDRLNLKEEDIFVDYNTWKKEYVLNNSGVDIGLAAEKSALAQAIDQAGEVAKGIDPTLKAAAEAAKVRALKIMEHLSGKLRKAEERNMTTALRQKGDIKERLFPGGSAQERIVNFLEFYLEDPEFIEKLISHLDPLDYDFVVLRKK